MNDLEKLAVMVNSNMDIRSSTNLYEAQSVKGGGHITMGVDSKTLMDVATKDDYYVILYVVNKEQFDKL